MTSNDKGPLTVDEVKVRHLFDHLGADGCYHIHRDLLHDILERLVKGARCKKQHPNPSDDCVHCGCPGYFRHD